MGDDSTGVPEMEPVPDDSIYVIGPPPDGFTILYNDACAVLMNEHGTVTKCYLALCLMSNGNRQAQAGRKAISGIMGGTGEPVSLDTVDRAVKRLEEIGLLTVERRQVNGQHRHAVYRLNRPEGGSRTDAARGSRNAAAGRTSYAARVAAPAMRLHSTSNTEVNEDITPLPPRHQESSTEQSTDQKASVSNKSGRLSEAHLPYWTDQDHLEARGFFFNEVAKRYPNEGADRQAAMTAWREAIGTSLDSYPDCPEALEILRGAEWYRNKVNGEKTPPQYIIRLPNWIRGQKWLDAPEVVRKGTK